MKKKITLGIEKRIITFFFFVQYFPSSDEPQNTVFIDKRYINTSSTSCLI